METLFVRNPLDSCRGRGKCGAQRRVTPTRRRIVKEHSIRSGMTDIPIRLTVHIEIETPKKE